MNKNNTPQIRFKGFTDAWEQRKLGDILKYEQPQLYIVKNTEYSDEFDIPVLTAGQSFILGYTNETYGIKLADSKNPIIIFDDFTTSSHYVDFPFKVKSSAMKLLTLVNHKDNIHFSLYNLKNIKYVPVSHERHWISKFSKINIMIPTSNDEQNRIGTLLSTIDNLITLHQRKLEKLQNIKKSYLEKMFPKNDTSVPEVRFANFTDAWEQRKLSSIAIMHARIGWQNLRKSEFLDSGDYYLITGTDFVDGEVDLSNCHYVEKERYEQDKNIQVGNGSILITKDGTLGKVAYIKDLDKPATLNAGVFNVVITDKNVDGKYLFQYLKAPFLMDYVDKKATGGTIKHLNQNILVYFPVIMPSYSEQKQLGKLFSSLDNLITLHQRKLEKLQNIKKSCLEKMFI